MKTATYTLHLKHHNMRQIGKIVMNNVDRQTLYGVQIDFDRPQKLISSGDGIFAKLARH